MFPVVAGPRHLRRSLPFLHYIPNSSAANHPATSFSCEQDLAG
jgi:hypothetical protein